MNSKDILPGFQCETIELKDDYEGKACAVLVWRKCTAPTPRAVLYIHGFIDYFFNTHLAEAWNNAGYDFYALDLRKYGRAFLTHQHPNFCKDLSEYFEELDKAVSIIRERDGHSHLVLSGHSTGGLTCSLYAHERRNDLLIDALVLSSPWLEINENWLTRNILIKFVYGVGKLSPFTAAPRRFDQNYMRSIHKDCFIEEKKKAGVYEPGLWDFNTEWKRIDQFPIFAGFLRAVRNGQKKLHRGLHVQCPILLLCSDKKGFRTDQIQPHYFNSDCVLDPAHMQKHLRHIGADCSLAIIKDGLHDLALSHRPVRDACFAEVIRWLEERQK